jgi:hypothetical protein
MLASLLSTRKPLAEKRWKRKRVSAARAVPTGGVLGRSGHTPRFLVPRGRCAGLTVAGEKQVPGVRCRVSGARKAGIRHMGLSISECRFSSFQFRVSLVDCRLEKAGIRETGNGIWDCRFLNVDFRVSSFEFRLWIADWKRPGHGIRGSGLGIRGWGLGAGDRRAAVRDRGT